MCHTRTLIILSNSHVHRSFQNWGNQSTYSYMPLSKLWHTRSTSSAFQRERFLANPLIQDWLAFLQGTVVPKFQNLAQRVWALQRGRRNAQRSTYSASRRVLYSVVILRCSMPLPVSCSSMENSPSMFCLNSTTSTDVLFRVCNSQVTFLSTKSVEFQGCCKSVYTGWVKIVRKAL